MKEDTIATIAARLERAADRYRAAGAADDEARALAAVAAVRASASLVEARAVESVFSLEGRRTLGDRAVMAASGEYDDDEDDDSDDAGTVPVAGPVGPPAYTKKPDVVLPDDLAKTVFGIADAYVEASGKMFTVTDGARTAADQAARLYDKLKSGDNLSVYKDKETAKQVKEAYDQAVKEGKSPEDTKAAMEKVIADRAAEGHEISNHLNGEAFDVRYAGTDRAALEKAAAEKGYKVIYEDKPVPHYHLQPK
jgi:hypothetical protein